MQLPSRVTWSTCTARVSILPISLTNLRSSLFQSKLAGAVPIRRLLNHYTIYRRSHSSSFWLWSAGSNMAATALPETLKSITATKIRELTQQRSNFEAARASISKDVSSAKDPLSAARTMLEGVCRLKNIRLPEDQDSDDDEYQFSSSTAYRLRNDNLLLRQAASDPSSPKSIVTQVQESLERDLQLESIRHHHAQFYSELVTEWLSNVDGEDQTSDSTNFEEVGRKEMHEQRATWESLVFKESQVNSERIEEYLKKLFTGTKAAVMAHENMVKRTKSFCSEMTSQDQLFVPESLKSTMMGLIGTDLLSEEKNATLRTFMNNKEVLKEVADVLNMRYTSLSTWQWTTSGKGVPVEMRRQLNGKYRVFMDEDLLDAILLYKIGLKWSVHFKPIFMVFFNSFAWKKSEKTIPKKDKERREFYLQNDSSRGDDIQSIRRVNYRSDYFMTQLPLSEEAGKRGYDEDNDDDDDEDTKTAKSPLELKHGLLHMLVAEALIAKEVNPGAIHTVIRSDFKWFGPALPHGTIYTVLKFFGVDDTWLNFFRRFLETPLFFIHDGPGAQAQTRRRGIPLSHSLSDVFGEAVLFVMDVAVNQATSSYLYRLHDDFWLWGSEDTCLKGWQSMTQFAMTMGIEFNEEKTGTVRFGMPSASEQSDSDSSSSDDFSYGPNTTSLPHGEVRWGFLRLDADSGRFVVDQTQVDEHIKELQLQLSYCKSIFSYIQSYNAYVGRFFTNNFGKPSFGFGRGHVDMMISTFARIQKALFPAGSVTDHLSALATERFRIEDLPQGFWYFPVEQGGMDLRNPLVPLLGMRETLRRSPERMLAKVRDEEEDDYLRAEQVFKDHGGLGFGKINSQVSKEHLHAGETFMPREEYFRYREQHSRYLGQLYKKFLTVPAEEQMQSTTETKALLSQGTPGLLASAGGKPGIYQSFDTLQPYWKWIVALYGREIIDRYGSVRMVDGGKVPLGVVSLMKKGRVRWRG